MYVLKITRLKKIIALIIRALKQHIEDTSPVEADMVPEVVIKRYDFLCYKSQWESLHPKHLKKQTIKYLVNASFKLCIHFCGILVNQTKPFCALYPCMFSLSHIL